MKFPKLSPWDQMATFASAAREQSPMASVQPAVPAAVISKPEMKKWRSREIVEAAKILAVHRDARLNRVTGVTLDGQEETYLLPDSGVGYFLRYQAKAGDYLVRHDDGFLSLCLAESFEATYSAVETDCNTAVCSYGGCEICSQVL